jgi:lipooligosaccharide transport system permease protein
VSAIAAVTAGGARFLLERNLMVYRRIWLVIFSGFFEPLFYLYAIGVGLGSVVVHTVPGTDLTYPEFVAPALLASSAMNGAFYDATNVFWKLRYGKVYEAMLSTPVSPTDVAVGETMWAVVRALLYSAAFTFVILVSGYILSWWAVLVLPAAFVIGFGFAGAGIAAVTWMRNWQDFDLVQLVMLPMFLFSATFYPITVYPTAIQWLVQAFPLYHGITLIRGLTTGELGMAQLVDVLYLVTMGLIGMAIASRRIDRLLLK